MSPSILSPFLRKLERHSKLTSEERQAILDLPFHPRQKNPNQDIVQQGQELSHSCFVLEGLVGTFGQNARGERQITSAFLPGDMIDLNSVVVPKAIASVQALVPTTILQVPHSALRKAASQHSGIAEAFWRECALNAAILNEGVVNVGRRDGRSRLAHLICEIAWRTEPGSIENGFKFAFPITQNQLGDMLGQTPVHVNRTLKGLRDDKIIETANRTIHILNWDRLVELGDFDPSYLGLDVSGGDLEGG